MKSDSFPHNLGKGEKFVFFALMGTAAVIVFGTLLGLLVQFLWNATLVGLLGVGEITFWQALGVLILAKLFFGFGNTGSSPKKSKKKTDDAPDDDPTKEQAFRDYWAQEGKGAYEAYKSSQQDKRDEAGDENK